MQAIEGYRLLQGVLRRFVLRRTKNTKIGGQPIIEVRWQPGRRSE